MQVRLQAMMAGHLVALAALLVQLDPEPPVLHVDVLDLHTQGRPDPGEGVDHEPDQGAVPQPGMGTYVDAVEESPSFVGREHRGLAA